MMKLQEDKLTPIIIDLSVKKSQINESFLRMFGASIELILKKMFGLNNLDFKVRGNKSAIGRLADTLNAETAYMKAFRKSGLNSPDVINNKWKLDKAIRHFEDSTGIKWPLK